MASEKSMQILEEIKTLTILELADLVKALEEEFGVSAAPVAVAGAAAPAAAAKAAPAPVAAPAAAPAAPASAPVVYPHEVDRYAFDAAVAAAIAAYTGRDIKGFRITRITKM